MHLRRPRAVLAAITAAAALTLLPVLPAQAATGTGWVRVAHLSPDTSQVDVRLAPLDDDQGDVVKVDDVAYGDVSKYLSLPAGDYAVAMRPAGAAESATPVISASVTVKAGSAFTVAVFGRNDDLQAKVIADSLATPKAGDARVRVVQASTGSDPVSVTAKADDEKTIVARASLATVSDYADVPAGKWVLNALAGSTTSTSTVDLRSGQIASLFVLEKADGDLTIKRVLDSSSVGDVPNGYLATGGGFLLHEQQGRDRALLLGGGAVLLALVAGGAVLAVRRRAGRA